MSRADEPPASAGHKQARTEHLHLDTVLGASDYDALVPGWTGALALALVEPGLVELELVEPELVSTAVVWRRGYSDLGYAGLEG